MEIRRKHVAVSLTAAAVLLLLALLLRPDRVTVETAVVDRGALRVTIDEDGETRVRDRYVVSSPVTGRMERLECEVGDSVAAGQVVARVYPLPLDTRVRSQAAEGLEAAEAAWGAARADAERAEAAHGEARRALERLRRVEADVPGAVAEVRLDRARTAERTAALALERARRAAEAAAHQVDGARAALLGAGDGDGGEPTVLLAPAAGRVLRLHEECERVVTGGSPILEVGDPRDLEVVVDVLTEDAARLRPGSPALVSVGPGADTLGGRIRRIEPSAFTKVSPLGVEEQRVNVVVEVPAAPGLGDRFRVDASLVEWEAGDVLRVPVSALFRVGGGWGVFVAGGGRAALRRVEVGHRGRGHAEVLEGLTEGERVVVHPSEEVADGVRVREVRDEATGGGRRP